MSLDFPASPSNGDVFNGFVYNSTLGAWDVATSSGKFTVTASGSAAYVFDGSGTISDSNPTLYLTRGQTYDFDVDANGHPFYIKTVSGTGTGNAYSDGVTNNGTESGTVTFTVQMDAPDTLYYNCANHSAMAGTIYVLDSTLGLSDFSVTTNSAGTAALTYSNSTGVFTYTPPDLSSYLAAVTFSDIDGGAVLLSTETFADVDTQLMTAAAIDDRIESKGYITSYTVTESDVTAHQAALSITESQISDLGSYLTSVALDDVSDVTITSASSGQVLKYNGAAWVNAADAGGIALTDLSVTTNAAGTAALSYNNSTGAFSYTPPDLSSYLTSYTVTESDVTTHQAALSITESQISDFGTYTNYANSDVDAHLNTSTAATNEVLSWNGTDYDWVAQSGGGGGIALTDLSVTTNTAGTAALSYNNTTGVFSYTPPDLSSYLTGITGQSIANLSDVYDSISPAINTVLQWDNVNSRWDAANAVTPNNVQSYIDTHINTGTAASNEILSWNGSDYEWIEQGIATVYSLTGTAIDPTNGGIQTKTISANTTFTETLASGESVVLMLEGAASYTITWPTITWVTSDGNSAPTLTAKDTLVLWKVSTTLYGAYVGSYA
jgi:hypothetical protein